MGIHSGIAEILLNSTVKAVGPVVTSLKCCVIVIIHQQYSLPVF